MFAVRVLSVSVILPTLNEAETIAPTLRSLATVEQVAVVDGGSTDATLSRVRGENVEIISCRPPGRARQMNRGARETDGEVLLFLHADTEVSGEALTRLREAFAHDSSLVGGGFLRRFDSPSLFLRATCRMADWRSRRFGLFLGDQGIFARRTAFDSLGGFDESLRVGEDLDFSCRLRRLGPTIAIGPPVVSSARRFQERGPVRQTLSDVRTACRILGEARRKTE